jgi:2-polyprenyl-3-methyl-5-hydroxy-6-metoxy-1,4-benzoquinol methylase
MIDKNSFDGSLQTKGEFFKTANFGSVHDQINSAVLKYVDPERKEIREKYRQERACLVCDSTDRTLLFRKSCFQHVRCGRCGFIYVNPMLREELLVEYYSAVSGSWADITEKEAYTSFQNKYYNFHLDIIEKHSRTSNKTILDIGCNNGEFLTVARSRGWQPVGHELNTYAVERARSKGIEVLEGKLSEETFKGRKFGAITFLGVLEHLPFPHQLLKIARAHIEAGGVLASLVPNADSLATRILQERSNTFDGIEHLNFWNRTNYATFIARCGFKLVQAETAVSELYTLNNYLNFEHPYSPAHSRDLLLPLDPNFINEHYLGHHLCCYSQPA